MLKNSLWKSDDTILRVLAVQESRVLVMDCIKRTMPQWKNTQEVEKLLKIDIQELCSRTEVQLPDVESLDAEDRRVMYERYTMIAGILPFLEDEAVRSQAISKAAEEWKVAKQTVRAYLCLYLAYQDISVLAPKHNWEQKELSADEQSMRWALNKFFYTTRKNSLRTAYTLMLKEKYCDTSGMLFTEYPSFYQFRYYYRKSKSLQNYYISRDGLKSYQRTHRPLLGDGVQEFAPNVGVGMLDATVCDIYLVDDAGNLVGRPILTACIDAYSSLCCGYSLSWEGGVYSLRGLMLNVIDDKVALCKNHGIIIQKEQWDSDKLPAVLVTDMGSEYKSETFAQIAELGVRVVNLPPYRPELKGTVEKFFDLLQDSYKPFLKGKGVIEPDYRERGAHDYRKDACLTMADFEKIILRCIVHYNSKRIIENFPYTDAMIRAKVEPFASCIWKWGKNQPGAAFIDTDRETLILTLLPRTTGRFSRNGLRVNQMRYKNDDFTERYLSGGTVTVAYNPEDVSCVWVLEQGKYTRFELIERRFTGMDIAGVQTVRQGQKGLVRAATGVSAQAQIDLAAYIETVAAATVKHDDVVVKEIRKNRQREQDKAHIDYLKAGEFHE